MKNLAKLISTLLIITMLCMSFAGCNNPAEDTSSDNSQGGNIDYTVNVKDYLGDAYTSGIVVQFMQNGTQVAMQPVNESGTAVKNLPAGDYNVVLAFTGSENAYHFEGEYVVTAAENQIDVILSNKITEEAKNLSVNDSAYDAYAVNVGCTYVELDAENRNYFFFTPTVAGNYQFSVANGANVEIGYYGAPHYVQEFSAAEVVDNSFTVNIKDSMIGSGDGGTTTLVIGIDSKESTSNCVLCIKRLGDPLRDVTDEPWTVYETTAELSTYVLPENYEIQEFDLGASTDTYNLVYNETDGFYHLDSVDGPLVLVSLFEDCEYIACFNTILDRTGVNKYFFDENGDFVKKESYDKCLREYLEVADEIEGFYPLTEDLKYIIQQHGEYAGWWDPDRSTYLFKDINGNKLTDINNEIAWLLMCCYIA